MLLLYAVLLPLLINCNTNIGENQQIIKIAMFSVCLRSHLRRMTSVAQELSQKPNVKVTLIVSKSCESWLNSQNYNFYIDAIPSPADLWKQEEITANTGGKYCAQYENSILESYVPKWNDSNNLHDIIVSDYVSFAGNDLAEIYKIPNIIISQNVLLLKLFYNEDFYPEYGPIFTTTLAFQATNNIFIRALRYLPKKIITNIIWNQIFYDPDIVRSKFGLPSHSVTNPKTFYIVESFYGLQFSMLLPPYVELVGTLENKSMNKPLDLELNAWLNNSKGFIYISTGSILSLTVFQQETLHKIFQLMDYDFLVSSKILKSERKNVKILEWVNQAEILQNKNILAHIGHGGFASLIESIQNAVPILCVPQENDQIIQCSTADHEEIGKIIKLEEFNLERVSSALNELINDEKYKRNMRRLKSILKKYKGKERAAEIVLQIAKTGTDHLIPRWKSLPWYQKNELDIFLLYALILWGVYACSNKLIKRKNNKKIE